MRNFINTHGAAFGLALAAGVIFALAVSYAYDQSFADNCTTTCYELGGYTTCNTTCY